MALTIHEVSEKTGLTSHTLRYYEKIGLLPDVKRNVNGIRLYNEHDLSWLELICCLRNTGMSIENIRQILELSRNGEQTIPERKQILKNHRKKLEKQMEELRLYLQKIDKKLNWYEQKCPDCQAEENNN